MNEGEILKRYDKKEKIQLSILDYILGHPYWTKEHKNLLIYLLQLAAENNAVHKINNPESEYNPDFFLGTTFSGYRLFAGSKNRHSFLKNVDGIKNTLLDYKNFPSFRNVPEVSLALQPAKRIHFLLEGLKPNQYLKERFFYGDSSDLKVVENRNWGVLDIGDTELEFLTISVNSDRIAKTKFYLKGREITYEETLSYLHLVPFGSGKIDKVG